MIIHVFLTIIPFVISGDLSSDSLPTGSGQCIKKGGNSVVRCLHEIRYRLDPSNDNSEEVVTKSFDRCNLEGDYEKETCTENQVCRMEIELFDVLDDVKLRKIYFDTDGIEVPVVSNGCVDSSTEFDDTRAHSCQQINGKIESPNAIKYFSEKFCQIKTENTFLI